MNRARLFRRPLSRYGNLRVGKLDSAATIALLLLIIALFYAGSLFFSFYAFASSNAPVQSDKVNSVDLPREHWMELQDIKALKSDPELLLQALRYWEYTAPAEVPEEQINWPENLDDGIERFLTFEVDPGGFNNIRMQFEIVIVMAHMLKRTLVLPPRQRYYLIGDDQAFDAFFDVDALRKVLNVITMDEYLTIHGQEMNSPHDIHEFLRNQPDTYFPKWETWSQFVAIPSIERCEKRSEWSESPWYPDYQSFRASRAPQQISREMLKMKNLHVISDPSKNYRLFGLWYPLFYFENPLWHHYYVKMIRGNFHYRSELFNVAAEIISEIVSKDGLYSALHIRRGDFQYKETRIQPAQIIENVAPLLNGQSTIFIATDEKMKNIFRPFQDSFGTVRYLNDFQHILDKHQISPGYYGMIDQLVCAASEVFIGTELSTFSAHIVRLREDIHRKIAPNKEVYFTTKRHTGIPEKDNIWSTVTWMRSSNPVWPHAVYFREFQQFLRFDGKTED